MLFYEVKVGGSTVLFATASLFNNYFKREPRALKMVEEIVKSRSLKVQSGGKVNLNRIGYYHTNISERECFAWRWLGRRLYIAAFGSRMSGSITSYSWITK